MDRRSFISTVGAAAGVAALGFPEVARADTDDFTYNLSNPNILVILVDQLRYKELGARTPGIATALPNITALQSQSVEFVNCIAAGTSCTASRAALQTGLYPTQTAMYLTQGDTAAPSLIPTFTVSGGAYTYSGYPTFGSYIQSHGYRTFHFGKWHLSDESNDAVDSGLNPYGYNYPTGDIPSPNGYPNEGLNGGSGAAPHQSTGRYNNDADIVGEFGSQMSSYWNGTEPWLAVVSLINPHDISSYPGYLLNYCTISVSSVAILPNFAPLAPGTSLPSLPALYNSAIATPNSCNQSVYTKTVTTGQTLPSNVTNDLSSKPSLQSTYKSDVASDVGSVDGASGGDWGDFLNCYYWLAGCADQLIGNLSTPNTTTILGLLAQNLTATNLANTIIVFTSDHGEYGGAHTLMGKNASSYEEAIHVPLFVRIPNEATMNRQRTQMVSLVDVFGMLASFASNYSLIPGSPGGPQWQANNPQLASREDLIQFMESNSHRNVKRVLTSGDSGFDKQPYALHTTSEFFANMFSKVPYGNAEKFHVVGLRTGPATSSISASSGLKLVYYYSWDDTYNSAPVFNPTTQPSSSYSEYYNLSADPGEMTNQSSSISSAIHATFSGVINSELQASMGTVNAVNLDGAVLPKAQASYNAYMSPPTGISVSPANPAHSTSSSVTLSISGTNIQRGCQVNVVNPAGVVQEFPIADTVDTSSNPAVINAFLRAAGTYTIVVINPSQANVHVMLVVS